MSTTQDGDRHTDLSSGEAQRDLLARHAPILRFDRRERFLPIPVDGYVKACSLLDPQGLEITDVPLAALDGRWSRGTYLRFISADDRRLLADNHGDRQTYSSSRLGRVGLFGRLLDALFLLSVWLRPTLHRRTATAAAIKAERLGLQHSPTCYGRVVRAGEWLVAHYAFFYAMNDWRTRYRGLNDHEADWEQAWVFIDPENHEPVWVATTNHDHAGPNMRRHWEDPEIEVQNRRPVLYVAAGSHAMLFRSGDYVTRIDIPGMRWVVKAQRFVLEILRAGQESTRQGLGPAMGVPFIDSAGGDGPAVSAWDVRLMGGADWIQSFRGLWGLDTGDPLQGERGPAGPKFDRRGEVRASWADPLGFAGLHGVPPPSAAATRVSLEKLERVLAEVDVQIRARARLLPLAHQTASADEMASESKGLTHLLRLRCELENLSDTLRAGGAKTAGVRDHLRQPAAPLPLVGRGEWIRAGWAALTIPALLGLAALNLLVDGIPITLVMVALVGLVLPVDQLMRGRTTPAVRFLLITAAFVGFATLAAGPVLERLDAAAGLLLSTAAIGLLVANFGELRRGITRAP